jgi:hypothetical protein
MSICVIKGNMALPGSSGEPRYTPGKKSFTGAGKANNTKIRKVKYNETELNPRKHTTTNSPNER